MLCHGCSSGFSFGDTEEILNIKDGLLNWSKDSLNSDEIQQLEDDLKRYNETLAGRNKDDPMPCPWDLTKPPPSKLLTELGGDLLPVCEERTWQELQDNAQSTACDLCRTLVAIIKTNIEASVLGTDKVNTYFVSNALIPQKLTCYVSSTSRFHVDPKMVFDFDCALEIADGPALMELTSPESISTLSESCLSYLENALAQCLSEHQECAHGQAEFVPTRLLDVQCDIGDHGVVQLINGNTAEAISGRTRIDYATLSHVWGKHKPSQLLQDNLATMQHGIKLKQLSRCFEDAIVVTRQLGLRYLWIDSLCIIQDSKADWETEAVTMHDVYQSGVCNIAACLSKSSDESLFVERDQIACTPVIFQHKFIDQTIRFTLLPDWIQWTKNKAPLYSRSWVVQERILSRRIMNFSQFPFFECREINSNESFSSAVVKQPFVFGGHAQSERNWAVKLEDKTLSNWMTLVSLYSRSNLTYKSDKLIAFAGLASAFSKLIDFPYFAGLWGKEFLIPSLMWEKSSLNGPEPSDYQAPSWSWACHNDTITYHNGRYGSLRLIQDFGTSMVQIIEVETTPKKTFGHVTTGKIILKGALVDIDPKDLLEPPENQSWTLDSKPSDIQRAPIYFLPLYFDNRMGPQSNDSGDRYCAGLLIQEAKVISADPLDRTFIRVGISYNVCRDLFAGDKLSEVMGLTEKSVEEYGQKIILI